MEKLREEVSKRLEMSKRDEPIINERLGADVYEFLIANIHDVENLKMKDFIALHYAVSLVCTDPEMFLPAE